MSEILLVEDDQTLRDAYALILQREPFHVDIAEDGVAALKLCRTKVYDLILLDLMMPYLDGAGFLKAFTTQSRKHKTHIIVLSNLPAEEGIKKVSKYRVQDIVVKADLSPAQLLEKVNTALNL